MKRLLSVSYTHLDVYKRQTAYSTKSGIKMDVITDCIGMQLYTANFIQGQKVQGGAVCKERDAFCLEKQYLSLINI